MQEIVSIKETVKSFKIEEIPPEDKQRLVGAFTWLIEEDKKQNPELYQIKKTQNNDRYNMSFNPERPDAIPFRGI
jgi:hypothetical protein